jgi:hypothetical protein
VNEQRAAADGLDTGYLRPAEARLPYQAAGKMVVQIQSPGRFIASILPILAVSTQIPGVGYARRRHQLCQPDEIVGCGRQREHPADPSKTTVIVLRKPAAALVQPNTSSMRLRTRALTA